MPDDACHRSRIAELMRQARAIGPLVEATVGIPGSDRSVAVVRPADIDALLEHVVDDPEQNLPYWAELWPSGIALAAAIAREPGIVRGRRVLELGSGIGITAALALDAGADLIATDYAAESLLLTRLTCRRHTGREPETHQLNWRAPLPRSLTIPPGGFPVVLAADVLYERRDIAPLLDLVGRIVVPNGILWLAEPGRPPAATFLENAHERGWSIRTTSWDGPWPDPTDAGVIARVHVLERPWRESMRSGT
ncbi:MAG: methyltransferase domain-containing protein [Chloroflexota bacterium]|nr:methyltransferase domain-containing protein [Chloroflexota bacterium]